MYAHVGTWLWPASQVSRSRCLIPWLYLLCEKPSIAVMISIIIRYTIQLTRAESIYKNLVTPNEAYLQTWQ